MLNDLGDKYDGQDEGEYRFSDEDIHFDEVESGSPKTSGPSNDGPKEGFLARLSRGKRMLISGGVFIVLVFIVYKMVAPTQTTPSTNIAPTASSQPMTTGAPQQAPQQQSPQTVAQAPQMQQPVQPVAQPVMQQQPETLQPTNVPQVAQQVMQQAQQAAATMPSMIPVQSPPSTYNLNQGSTQATSVNTPLTPLVNASMGTLSATSDKAYAQFQADYAQKLNDYAVQNKMLQDQLNILNARVASMESQLHQLVQALTHQSHGSTEAPAAAPPHHAPQGLDARLAYSVQAIIPGRAWLRSDSGETVTVAEGDVIKDLGRVTKIDPYDGIVEVNTGTKTLSLSYGNGG